MKIYIALSVVLTTSLLFVLSAEPETVTSSTAMSVQNTLPTMPSFPSIDVRIPEFQYAQPLTISVSSRPRPTFPGNTATVTPSPTQTAEVVLTPIVTASPKTTVTSAPVQESVSSVSEEVIKLVNAERAKVNLVALTKNSVLTSSAQKYAQYMADSNFFSHDGKDGSTFITRNKAAGYTNYTWMGENIAAGQGTAQQAMNDWMKSPGHKANILHTKAKEIGVGYATNNSSNYKKYWAQEFGAK